MASAAWEARNARARAAGFKNYYEQRILGGVGAAQPGSEPPSGEELERARGHRSFKDALRAVKHALSASVQGSDRKPDGTFRRLQVVLIDSEGRDQIYSFGWTEMRLQALIEALDDADVPYVAYPAGLAAAA